MTYRFVESVETDNNFIVYGAAVGDISAALLVYDIILLLASAVITSIVPLIAVALESTLGLAIPTTDRVNYSSFAKSFSKVTVSF